MIVAPKVVRRAVVAPVVVAVDLAIVVASPLLALVAAIASPLTGGHWRPLRVVAIGVSWAGLHLVAMLRCLGLWAAGGVRRADPARSEAAYHGVMRWFVARINGAIKRL